MKISYLQEFAVLADVLNYTKASDQLFMAQPTLSKHISAMEEELGVKLLSRSKHEVKLTEAGLKLLKACQSITGIYNGVLSEIHTDHLDYHGTIKVGVLYHFINEFASPIIEAVSERLPEIEIEMVTGRVEKIVDSLWADEFDVIEFFNIDMPGYEELSFIDLATLPFVAAMSTNHKLATKDTITLQEINGEKLILNSQTPYMSNYVRSLLLSKRIDVKQTMQAPLIDTIGSTVKKENAIAIFASVFRGFHKDLTYADIADSDFSVSRSLVYKTDITNPAMIRFLPTLRTCITELSEFPR